MLTSPAAISDPRVFLAFYPPPVIFDEIQTAPGLLPYIKEKVDADRDRAGPGGWRFGQHGQRLAFDPGSVISGFHPADLLCEHRQAPGQISQSVFYENVIIPKGHLFIYQSRVEKEESKLAA
jgi:hypothetical protein